MMRIRASLSSVSILACMMASALGQTSFAQDKPDKPAKPDEPAARNSKIVTETITLTPAPDAKINCYLAHPAGDSPAPGILLIHEWWGLNDWVRKQADRFAEQGYVALAVD